MTKNKWEHFERLVAALHKAVDAGALVKLDDTINGRQFDATIRFRRGLYDYLTVVECKDYERPVSVEKVEAFVTKSRDVHANVAVLASSSGFQSGAREVAQRHDITLLHVTRSDDVDPAVFGARLGFAPIEALLIREITLEFVGGDKTLLPTRSNVLTYYAKHTILECAGKRIPLDWEIDRHRQALSEWASTEDYVIPVPDGTVIVAPDDGVVPLKPLLAIRVRGSVEMARELEGPNGIDPAFLMADVNVRNVSTGEERRFKYSDLPLGIDNSFIPGHFYEEPALAFFYYCNQVTGGSADLYLVESFQHGQLLQARITMRAKYGDRYIPVKDKKVLERLQGRLDRLKGTR